MQTYTNNHPCLPHVFKFAGKVQKAVVTIGESLYLLYLSCVSKICLLLKEKKYLDILQITLIDKYWCTHYIQYTIRIHLYIICSIYIPTEKGSNLHTPPALKKTTPDACGIHSLRKLHSLSYDKDGLNPIPTKKYIAAFSFIHLIS